MPIEIKELIIRISTEGGQAGSASAPELSDKDAIVQDCVKQVLKILKQSKER